MSERIPILMYHDVTPAPVPGFEFYSVTNRAFTAQMRLLAWLGYTTIGLDALVQRALGESPLPSRSVVLTFDDGFKSCIDNAVPQLRRFGFTATFFVVPGLVGQGSRWLRSRLGRELPLADWVSLRGLVKAGMECGAHSLTHPHLTELTSETSRFEMAESKRLLEEQLECPVPHMAYPYGAYNAEVCSLAQEVGFSSACAVRGGHSGPRDDRFALRRIVIGGGDSLFDFACRLHTAQPLREFVRQKAGLARFVGGLAQ